VQQIGDKLTALFKAALKSEPMRRWSVLGKVVTAEELSLIAEAEKKKDARSSPQTVVLTFACWHAPFCNKPELGDCLFVGLNSDDSVKRLKDRPINNEVDRAELLAHLASVDYVYVFGEDTPVEFLKMVKPNVHVKGADYTAAQLAETPVVESFGGKVTLLPLVPSKSTTSLVEKIKS
jgi:rfaE bifunctional protein nucleotidyltransferase chain/domain